MDDKSMRQLVLELINKHRKRPQFKKTTDRDWQAFYANRDTYMRELERQEQEYMTRWISDINDKYYND